MDHADKFILMEKQRTPDAWGTGWLTSWADGIEFDAVLALDSSIEARQALAVGVVDIYTGYVDKNLPVIFGDYIKRKSDDETFRITSSPGEKATPSISEMDFKVFSASKSSLPS